MAISVVLCTYNRAASLAECLPTIEAAAVRAPAEIVVVDNNSADDTPQVIQRFAAQAGVPVRPVREPRQGLAFARNAGVAAAGGDIVAFTDDDVSVAPDWLERLGEAFARGATAAGGPILPAWGAPVPDWLTPGFHRHFAVLDLGPEAKRLDHADIWGANFAVRAEALRRFGPFPTHLGHRGKALGVGEESALLQRMIEAGEPVWYTPDARVRHRIPAERMTKAYVLRHEYGRGIQEGSIGKAGGRLPLWLPRMLLETGIFALWPGGLERRRRFVYWTGYAVGGMRESLTPTPGHDG